MADGGVMQALGEGAMVEPVAKGAAGAKAGQRAKGALGAKAV